MRFQTVIIIIITMTIMIISTHFLQTYRILELMKNIYVSELLLLIWWWVIFHLLHICFHHSGTYITVVSLLNAIFSIHTINKCLPFLFLHFGLLFSFGRVVFIPLLFSILITSPPSHRMINIRDVFSVFSVYVSSLCPAQRPFFLKSPYYILCKWTTIAHQSHISSVFRFTKIYFVSIRGLV